MKSPRDAAVQNSIAKLVKYLEHDAKLAKHFSHTLATQQKNSAYYLFFQNSG